MRSATLNVVALVIHDHAGTHVPVQYIQAYIQALLVQLEQTHGMRTLRVLVSFLYSKTGKHTCPICPIDPYFVCGEDEKAYIADFVRSPIASTFMPGLHVQCSKPIQVQVTE